MKGREAVLGDALRVLDRDVGERVVRGRYLDIAKRADGDARVFGDGAGAVVLRR